MSVSDYIIHVIYGTLTFCLYYLVLIINYKMELLFWRRSTQNVCDTVECKLV